MKVRIVNDCCHAERVGEFDCFEIGSPTAVVFFGAMVGRREFSLNSGFGKKVPGERNSHKMQDWRVHPEDLETLRGMAREAGKTVRPCGKSPGRPRQPRKAPEPDPRQLHFGSVK